MDNLDLSFKACFLKLTQKFNYFYEKALLLYLKWLLRYLISFYSSRIISRVFSTEHCFMIKFHFLLKRKNGSANGTLLYPNKNNRISILIIFYV
jgi:hypothetical protein